MTSPRTQFGALTAFVLVAFAALGVLLTLNFGADAPFMPHAHCYLFNRPLMLLHGGSDVLIGASYVAISATLVYLVLRARHEIPFHWMMLAFAVFIIACGATHFMEVWTLQTPHPRYWLSGYVKLITAIASVVTAILLPPLIPKVLSLLESARLSAERKVELESAYTELGNVYEKVKQLDQMKTAFFANVSHELRTPLALIIGPVDRMLERTDLGERERHELQGVRRNAVMLHKHVNDLLDISSLEEGKLALHYTRTDVARLARLMGALFDSIVHERLIKVVIEAPDHLFAEVDAEKLQRVLVNLLSNAFKFTPEGGQVKLVLHAEEDSAVFCVEDTGPGVPEEFRATIFERFSKGPASPHPRFGGSGLGLSIVKEFLELHGGSVRIDTATGGGAVFIARIPLKAPEGTEVADAPPELASTAETISAADAASKAESEWAAAQIRRWPTAPQNSGEPSAAGDPARPLVLIVEDNPEMNEFIAQVLSSEFRTVSALDGKTGLELARREHPDLVLTDVMMPAMSGDELLDQLRDDVRLSSVPIILLTAKADDELKANLLAKGAQDYVMKPFAIDELRARVRNQVVAKLARDTLQHALATQDDDIAQLATNLTQRARQLAEARDVAEHANRAKDQFLAVLSHELRTPLTPALVAATAAEESQAAIPPEVRQSLGVIRRNIELEARLIDDLLDITRINRGKLQLHLEPADVHRAIRDALEMVAAELSEKQIAVAVDLAAERSFVSGDAPRLMQVFWNLILNSVKFTPERGGITIRSFNRPDGWFIAEVRDTGVGIAPEILPRIFEPFEQGEATTTRRFGGLGLGLTVARAFVEGHGGRIFATSSGLNLGTTMTIELPTIAAPNLAAPGTAAPAEEAAPNGKVHILLAEDHVDTREAVVRLLRRWGFEVSAAGSVGEALELGRANRFDLLLSDLGLPDGSGNDLLRELLKFGSIPAIAMSGFGMEHDVEETRAAGFVKHLIKPVAAQKLRDTIAEVMQA